MKRLLWLIMLMVMTSMAHAELVFYAPFDGDTTSVTDLSGQGNHGTLGTGTSITTIDVKLGSGAADLADGNAGILGSTDNVIYVRLGKPFDKPEF